MGFWDFLKKAPSKQANYGGGTYRTIYSEYFDGEKNIGEVGPVKDYLPNYEILRIRSWQMFMESDIAQTIIKKHVKWVVGTGLKLQAEPTKKVLEMEGITLDTEEFNNTIEAYFSVFAASKESSHSQMRSLNRQMKDIYKNAIVGGDVLVILRYEKGRLTVQTIDGAKVQSPMSGTDISGQKVGNGNTMRHGVELDDKGEHQAYWVRTAGFTYKRIAAKNRVGLRKAFLVYGLEFRLDNHRGLPLISCCLESIKKLERYKEATVGSAEERQKISLYIKHNEHSTGENPWKGAMAKIMDASVSNEHNPKDLDGNQLAAHVTATTNKQSINLPAGADLGSIESKNELYFKDFFTENQDLIFAAMDIPPDIAKSKYLSSYSASRASIKDWEHTLNVNRKDLAEDSLEHIYHFFMDAMVMSGKISAPGYLEARIVNNMWIVNAYRSARFVGPHVPHIDPVKEVQAERLKLGSAAQNVPLTTVEAATEALNNGDSDQNIRQFAREMELVEELGIADGLLYDQDMKDDKDDKDDE